MVTINGKVYAFQISRAPWFYCLEAEDLLCETIGLLLLLNVVSPLTCLVKFGNEALFQTI